MFTLLIWSYWYLWAGMLAGLTLAAICGCWLWQRRKITTSNESLATGERSSRSCYPHLSSVAPPPHYSRYNSFSQSSPPPYNEVTAKPDLYPIVIDFEESGGKVSSSSFVQRCFHTLSHTSTFDSLNSSFMCNVVNEANTIYPPPYAIESCNNSIDGLSALVYDRCDIDDGDVSNVSLAHNQTTSDISSLLTHSPCSPPQATSPTIEFRELLDKIRQLPNDRPQTLAFSGRHSPLQNHSANPAEYVHNTRIRRAAGKTYMPLNHQITINRNKCAKLCLSRSAPTTPSGNSSMAFVPFQSSLRSSNSNSYNDSNQQQVIPLLSELDENFIMHGTDLFNDHQEESNQL